MVEMCPAVSPCPPQRSEGALPLRRRLDLPVPGENSGEIGVERGPQGVGSRREALPQGGVQSVG